MNPLVYVPRPDQIYAAMENYNLHTYEGAVATCRYAHALWLGRRRNWIARDCDAGGQVLIERPWGLEQRVAAIVERDAIRDFATKRRRRDQQEAHSCA